MNEDEVAIRTDGTPDVYYLAALTIAPEAGPRFRPSSLSGTVVLLDLKDETGHITIPWPEGMTAVEALRHWKAQP